MVKIQIFMGTLCGKKLCMFPNICREQKWQTNKHIFTNEYETLGFIWKTVYECARGSGSVCVHGVDHS